MNRLIEHIDYLLFENDFIVVPKLGGFIVNKEQAFYDNSKHVLCPPYHWIGFNQSLSHNDGLLLQLYMKTQSLPSLQAERLLMEDVEKLKEVLYSEKELTLKNWGKLHVNEENIIGFSGNKTGLIRPQLFGLEDLSISTLEAIRTEDETFSADDRFKRKRIIKKTLAFASATAAAALLLFTISIPITEKKKTDIQYAGFFSEKVEHATPSLPSLNKDTARQEVKTNLITHKEKVKEDPSDNYYLVVSTFQTSAVANQQLKIFQAKGYTQSGIIESYRAKKIYVAGFKNINQAHSYLVKFIKENPQNKDAWIYLKKETDKFLR